MHLSDDFMQQLKARIDIVDVISDYTSLKRSGRNLVGLCPFHGEKTPSFNIYPESNSFYCFGCGCGGDVITFVRLANNLDYIDAVKLLAERANLKIDDNVSEAREDKRKTIYEINKEAARFFHNNLISERGEVALSYFTGRNMKMSTIKHFGLGYADESYFSLVNHLRGKGYKDEDIILANLAIRSRKGNVVDRFVNRVMFPIINNNGKVIAFGGRVLDDSKPKYLNTSDTLVFKKSSNLFALNFAKNSGKKQLILCEGYMDVIAMHQIGFNNAVATLGTSLTSDQARLMRRYAEEVFISYDADEAGQKAAYRAISIFREIGMIVKVISIPGCKDPDEFIKKYGKEARVRFEKILESSMDDIEYKLQKIKKGKNLEIPSEKVEYLTKACEALSELESKIEQEIYSSKLSQELGIDKSAIKIQINKFINKRRRSEKTKVFKEIQKNIFAFQDKVNPEKAEHLRAAVAEEALISYIMHHPDKVKEIYGRLPPDRFCTSFNKKVYENIIERTLNEKGIELSDLSVNFSPEEMGRITRIMGSYISGSGTDEAMNEYINIIIEESDKIKFNSNDNNDIDDIKEYIGRLKFLKNNDNKY